MVAQRSISIIRVVATGFANPDARAYHEVPLTKPAYFHDLSLSRSPKILITKVDRKLNSSQIINRSI